MPDKRCSKCKRRRPVEDFNKNRRAADGLDYSCRICHTAHNRKYKLRFGREKLRQMQREYRQHNREKVAGYERKYREMHKGRHIIRVVKSRSKRLGLPFDLDQHEAKLQRRFDAGVCEITGIPLRTSTVGRVWNSASIDRIVPSKGYLYSNIRVVCLLMNVAMSDWGEKILADVVKQWMERKRKK